MRRPSRAARRAARRGGRQVAGRQPVRVVHDRDDQAALGLRGEAEVDAARARRSRRARCGRSAPGSGAGRGRRTGPAGPSRLTGRSGIRGVQRRRVSSRSVASTSTQTVASGISRRERDSLSAATRRAPRSGIRRSPGTVPDRRSRCGGCSAAQSAIACRTSLAADQSAGPCRDAGQVDAGVPGELADQRRDHRDPRLTGRPGGRRRGRTRRPAAGGGREAPRPAGAAAGRRRAVADQHAAAGLIALGRERRDASADPVAVVAGDGDT